MGYLSSDSITVDATLTDFGRRMLAEHGHLGIEYYAFGDTGVDYYLFNESHPNGSDSAGEAITRLPQLEANPHQAVSMRYTLTTMPRNTIYIPKITVEDLTITDTTQKAGVYLRPKTEKMAESGETYDITFYNTNPLVIDTKFSKDLSTHVSHNGLSGTGLFLPQSGYPTILQYNNKKEMFIKARAIQAKTTVTYRVYGRISQQVAYGTITVEETI